MANLEYFADSRDIEDVLDYYCDYCKHKKHCQLRATLLTPATKWTLTQMDLVNKSCQERHCKHFANKDPLVKPPLPKDRDRR